MSVAATCAFEDELAAAPPACARVQDRFITELPRDLYIPPDALEVVLDAFEGPLDLLLYLIKRQNLDILDIPIAELTRQYAAYIELMAGLKLELAAEYLLMSATLAEIKSRLLLPRPASLDGEEADPRALLVQRLLEYERFRCAARALDALPRQERDIYPAQAAWTAPQPVPPQPTLAELLAAAAEVLARASLRADHCVLREPLSVRARMAAILERLAAGARLSWLDCCAAAEGRLGLVVSLLAVLELAREGLLDLEQSAPYAPIAICRCG